MYKSLSFKVVLTIIVFSLASNIHATISNVEILNAIDVVYPKDQLTNKNEGWVMFNFMVSNEGKAEKIIIIDHAGNTAFKQAALDALKAYEFKPAMYKEKTVSQNIHGFVMDFTLPVRDQVDNGFNEKYTRLIEKINNKELETADAQIKTLTSSNNLSLEKLASLDLAYAQIAAHRGDVKSQLMHLKRAKIANGQFLTEAAYINALKSIIAISLKNSFFFDAFESYRQLEQIAPFDKMVTRLALTIGPIKKAIEEGRPVQVRGSINDDGFWVHTPIRDVFAFSALEDGVNEIEARCERKSQKFPVNTENEWRIPLSWGACTLVVYGQSGARFDLLELQKLNDES